MGVYHRCTDVFVPEKFLHRPDIVPRFEQMGRKRVPQRVTTGRLGNIGLADGSLHRPLQDQFVDVMPPDNARPWVPRRLRGWEDILPYPLAIGIGVFALQRIWQ